MAGKGQSGGRREPVFDSAPELRVARATGLQAAGKPPARRKRTKPSRKRGPRRSLIGRAIYWSLVLGLWLVIGVVGVRRLDRCAYATAAVAGNPQTAAVDPDRRYATAARSPRAAMPAAPYCR